MLLATNVGLITLGSFIFSFLAKGLHDAIWTDSGGHRSWLQASIFAAMSSLLVLLMGWVAHQVLKQQLVIDTSHLQMLIAISFVTPLAMAIVARLSELEVRRDEAWGQLDIAE